MTNREEIIKKINKLLFKMGHSVMPYIHNEYSINIADYFIAELEKAKIEAKDNLLESLRILFARAKENSKNISNQDERIGVIRTLDWADTEFWSQIQNNYEFGLPVKQPEEEIIEEGYCPICNTLLTSKNQQNKLGKE